jgi:hypothetical protein
VFNSNGDPIRLGLVASFNRPGGNMTGVSLLTTAEVIGKRLELLHMLLPKAQLLGLLVNARSVNSEAEARAAQAAAQVTGQQVAVNSVAPEGDLEVAYAALVRQGIVGLIVQSDPLFFIATVRPSIQPNSSRRCTKAACQSLQPERVPAPKNPMVGSFEVCCARAANGHAAAPPSRVMNSRRFIIRSPRRHGRAAYPVR